MSEYKQKMLKLMRFWMFGTFIIISAVVITSGSFIPGLYREWAFWASIVAAAVVTVIWYFAYRWWLGTRPDEVSSAPAPEGSQFAQAGDESEPEVSQGPPSGE